MRMFIPNGWLFRVHGYSEGSYFNSKLESNKQERAQPDQDKPKTPEVTAGRGNFPVQAERSPISGAQSGPGAPRGTIFGALQPV